MIAGPGIPNSLFHFGLWRQCDYFDQSRSAPTLWWALIDDAIVVLENIFVLLKKCNAPFQAAIEGTREIGLMPYWPPRFLALRVLAVGFSVSFRAVSFPSFGLPLIRYSGSLLVSLR